MGPLQNFPLAPSIGALNSHITKPLASITSLQFNYSLIACILIIIGWPVESSVSVDDLIRRHQQLIAHLAEGLVAMETDRASQMVNCLKIFCTSNNNNNNNNNRHVIYVILILGFCNCTCNFFLLFF